MIFRLGATLLLAGAMATGCTPAEDDTTEADEGPQSREGRAVGAAENAAEKINETAEETESILDDN
ncbi:MAG: hypothetical protein ACFB21_13615 [Opitutales bacterium]